MANLKEKYQVRKIIDGGNGEATESKTLPQEDFFVLRRQDILAVHALWAYVQTLHLACDLLQDGPEKANLAIKADAVADLAYEWQDFATKKLPD